jgi:hypothetical protein
MFCWFFFLFVAVVVFYKVQPYDYLRNCEHKKIMTYFTFYLAIKGTVDKRENKYSYSGLPYKWQAPKMTSTQYQSYIKCQWIDLG